MEVMERICQSVYGTYIRGATTIAARYIGHPAVAIPASEMVKTMMDEVAPPINKYCVIHTEQKQKIETNDIVQIAQIYKNAIEETKQYLKDKKLYIPTVNDYLLTGYNGTIQSVQYLMDKYCPELGETLDNIKAKKAEMISYFYENNRQIYIKNPEIGTVFDKMLFDVPIDEKNMNVFEKAEVAMDGVASGFLKDVASGANAVVDMTLSPLDTAEALTSPGALTLGTIWNGMTEDIKNDWQKGTIQGKSETIGRVISIISPIEILKSTGVIGKGTKVAGTLGKGANVVGATVDATKGLADVADAAVDITKGIANVGDTMVDLTKGITNVGDMTVDLTKAIADVGDTTVDLAKGIVDVEDTVVDITRGLEETKGGLANTGKNFTDDITKKFESTNSAKKPFIETDDVLQKKPDKTPEQKPKETSEQNETIKASDDGITVKRGDNSGANSSGVKISGEKPKTDVGEVKVTGAGSNNVVKDKMPTNNAVNKTNVSEVEISSNINVTKEVLIRDEGILYTPMNPGPLPKEIAETFTGGSYVKKVLKEDTVFYRAYGGNGKEVGRYVTRIPQNGGIQTQIDLVLNPDWGNTTEYITKVVVPKGTIIYEGTAAPQIINGGAGMLLGGGNQIYIPEVDASWFGK